MVLGLLLGCWYQQGSKRKEMQRIAVFGGLSVDILGKSAHPLIMKDSNIGKVNISSGGVGHNIAARLVDMGNKVYLVSALGNDALASWVYEQCAQEGIDLSYAITVPYACPIYLAVHDIDGDMALALNDMRATESLSKEQLLSVINEMIEVDYCVLDTNLSEEALQTICTHVKAPIMLDPVSIEKGKRAQTLLGKLTAIKPNLIEAQSMTGMQSPKDCAKYFLDHGVKNVFISMGQYGVYVADQDKGRQIPALTFSYTTLTGAGDAMCAGIVHALACGADAIEAAHFGQESSKAFLTNINN
jgi:pseudouridine kinase